MLDYRTEIASLTSSRNNFLNGRPSLFSPLGQHVIIAPATNTETIHK